LPLRGNAVNPGVGPLPFLRSGEISQNFYMSYKLPRCGCLLLSGVSHCKRALIPNPLRPPIMNLKPIISALALFALSAGAQTLHAEDSPRKFVQDFYDWYVPMAARSHSEDASNIALKKKSSVFSPELLKALKEDAVASSKSPGEIVGLDWDPFLNSQEQIERCVLGNTTPKGGAFRVEIYDILGGKKDKKPNIIAEVKQENGQWVFVNFWNPDGGNLLNELRELSKSRKKTAK